MTDSSPAVAGADPTAHYNAVVEAWGYLLGEDLHYGYFAAGSGTLGMATDALTDEMLARAGLAPGAAVLDVGCGTGKAGCRIAAEYGGQVLGISPSERCVSDANARATGLGLESAARFTLGDGTAMALADSSFDAVWVMESSHLMENKAGLLAECARVLKPGGTVVLCDIMLKQKLPLERVIEYRDEFLLLRDVFGRARMEPLDFYAEGFAGQGLEVRDATDITAQTRPTFGQWRANASSHKAEVEALIGTPAWQQFLDSCDVLEQFWDADVLGYGIVSAVKPAA